MECDYHNFQIGDLVRYIDPQRFFSKKQLNMLGIITDMDSYFAKVLWQDALWCLESFEDLEEFKPNLHDTKGS